MKSTLFALLTIILLVSCASQPTDRSKSEADRTAKLKISPNTWNAAPVEKFSNFGRFELSQVKLAEPLQSDPKKQQVSTTAGKVVSDRLNLLFSNWEKQSSSTRTLLIEPTLTQFKIVSRGARFWAGALAGGSNAHMEVVMKDKESGKVISSPFFFQGANAMAAAWTYGSHDQSIPERLAVVFEKYMSDNYSDLAGGPTGKDK